MAHCRVREPRKHRRPPASRKSTSARKDWRHLAIAALLAVIVAGAIIFMFARRDPPTASDAPTILAVLPFEQRGSADPWLAQGLWDDTRNALSRNGRLRLMGRTTVEAMATRNATADQYRRQLKVDYLLEGSVQRASNRVRVMVSLTRTSDGVTIWEDAFQGKLGDPLALQDAIANAIEGRLRGRLARGGGRRAEQIGTTPEVYSLYSEARSLIYERRTGGSKRAQVLLRSAVRLDPNYAPAWAALAETTHFVDYGPGGSSRGEPRAYPMRAGRSHWRPNWRERTGYMASCWAPDRPAGSGNCVRQSLWTRAMSRPGAGSGMPWPTPTGPVTPPKPIGTRSTWILPGRPLSPTSPTSIASLETGKQSRAWSWQCSEREEIRTSSLLFEFATQPSGAISRLRSSRFTASSAAISTLTGRVGRRSSS